MEEQAKQALADLLERAVDGVDSAVAFSQAQIPDVVEQLLMWHTVKSAIPFAIFGVSFILSIALPLSRGVIAKKLSSGAKERYREALDAYEKGEAWTRFEGRSSLTSLEFDRIKSKAENGAAPDIFYFVAPAMAVAAFSVVGMLANTEWLQIWIAPKLYLLEYAADLVK